MRARMLAARRRARRSEQHIALGPGAGPVLRRRVDARASRRSTPTGARRTGRPTPPLFTLQLYGAGHVGRAIVRLLATLTCRVDWIDERESEFPRRQPLAAAHRARVRRAGRGRGAAAPPGAFYLVLTHSHDLDLRITEAILRRGDFGWFGLIGSKTKRARFVHRFERARHRRAALRRA